MGVFVCDKCNCVENSALGHYWGRKHSHFKDKSLVGKALCSECAPTEWKDGSKTSWGKWHGKFPKIQWDQKSKMMNR